MSTKEARSQPNTQPSFQLRNGRAAVDFYNAAFGAVEVYRFGGTDDLQDVVAQLAVGDSLFWVEDESPTRALQPRDCRRCVGQDAAHCR